MDKTFEDLGLGEELLNGLKELGFVKPTPIQAQAIPYLLTSENDLIGLAQTGTGKTAAFSLPILEQIDLGKKKVQALILSPTRELCLQICRDIETYSKHQRVKSLAVYGGSDINKQIKALKSGVHIVVGTPGRTLDLIKRRKLLVNDLEFLVLDEADEMLSMGFQESLDDILAGTPDEKQTTLFSATMPKAIRKMASKYMNNPFEISVISEHKSTSNVTHEYYVTQEKNRYKVLKRLADYNHDMYGIVFCRTRRETQKVADMLMQDGYSSDTIHGDLSQSQRDNVMKKFREKRIQMLVATDVAARGIDVNDLTHVINYNLPDSLETYVHRSGRTGRADKTGICITILNTREGGKVRQLEKKIEKKFELKLVPHGSEICKKRMMKLVEKVEVAEIDTESLQDVLEEVYERLSPMKKKELINRFVAVEFNRFLDYYKGAGDLNAEKGSSSSRDSDFKRSGSKKFKFEGRFTRYFINIGKEHKISPTDIISLINQVLPGKKLDIGDINLQRDFSFFEIEEGAESLVLKSFKGQKFKDHTLNVEIANPKPKSESSRRYGGSGGGGYKGKSSYKGKSKSKSKYGGDKKSSFRFKKEKGKKKY